MQPAAALHAIVSSIVACGKDGGGRRQHCSSRARPGASTPPATRSPTASSTRGDEPTGASHPTARTRLYVAARSGAVVGDSRLHAPALLRFALDGADARARDARGGDGARRRRRRPLLRAVAPRVLRRARVYLADKSARHVPPSTRARSATSTAAAAPARATASSTARAPSPPTRRATSPPTSSTSSTAATARAASSTLSVSDRGESIAPRIALARRRAAAGAARRRRRRRPPLRHRLPRRPLRAGDV